MATFVSFGAFGKVGREVTGEWKGGHNTVSEVTRRTFRKFLPLFARAEKAQAAEKAAGKEPAAVDVSQRWRTTCIRQAWQDGR